jgi:hypothetical protein
MSTIRLTHENLHALATAGCGFNRAQLAILGVEWPPIKGWLSGLIGCEIPAEAYDRAMALRGLKRKHRSESGPQATLF